MKPNLLFIFVLTLNCFAFYPGIPLQSAELLVHLPMNGNTRDISGHEHHGEGSSPKPTIDRQGNLHGALHFSGEDQLILNNTRDFNFPGKPFTVSFWVKFGDKPQKSHWGFIVAKHQMFTANGWGVATENREIHFGVGEVDKRVTTNGKFMDDSRWHHIVATYDGECQSLHVDGKLYMKNQKDYTRNTDTPITIAFASPSGYFVGAIDDLRIYEGVASLEETLSSGSLHRERNTKGAFIH